MSTLDYCLERRKAELPAFLKVLRAMPTGRLDYKPEPRSRSAAELGWMLAEEEAALLALLDTGVIDWKDSKAPSSTDAIVAAFEKNAAAVNARLEKLDADGWKKPAKFVVDGNAVWEDTTSGMFWGFLFDAIHHRGQLSTYLRPMGGKVPAIYGPSADGSGQ